MSPAASLTDLIAVVHSDAPSSDPSQLLRTAVETAEELNEATEALLNYFVDRCRGNGRSWAEVGAALGVTRQAAHKRFTATALPTERLTERALRVVELSSTAARSLNHNYIGTEHLLLALLVEGQGVAARILLERGVTHQAVEAAALMVAPRGETPPVGDIPFNPRATTTLTGATTAAIELRHDHVGTEHLLLGLIRDPDGLAARILAANRITADEVRQRVVDLVGEPQVSG